MSDANTAVNGITYAKMSDGISPKLIIVRLAPKLGKLTFFQPDHFNLLLENRTMTIEDFIKEHRQELDDCIQRVAPGSPKSDTERRLWILNDEGLYNWARSAGVCV